MNPIHTRVSDDARDYLNQIIRAGYAEDMSEAVRLIVTERMTADGRKGTISPFHYRPAVYHRGTSEIIVKTTPQERPAREKLRIAAGPVPGERSAEDAPHIGGPVPPQGDIIQSGDLKEQECGFTCEEYARIIERYPEQARYMHPPIGWADYLRNHRGRALR